MLKAGRKYKLINSILNYDDTVLLNKDSIVTLVDNAWADDTVMVFDSAMETYIINTNNLKEI